MPIALAPLLRDAVREAGVTQSELARITGIRQPTISNYLSGKVEPEPESAERLFAALGLRLVVEPRVEKPDWPRSTWRSWALHRRIASKLSPTFLAEHRDRFLRNLDRADPDVRGEPHRSSLAEWRRLIEAGDVEGIRRVLDGVDAHAVAMRDVSPLNGALSERERLAVLEEVG